MAGRRTRRKRRGRRRGRRSTEAVPAQEQVLQGAAVPAGLGQWLQLPLLGESTLVLAAVVKSWSRSPRAVTEASFSKRAAAALWFHLLGNSLQQMPCNYCH